jgi:ATP-binding cassette subfamily C (CFTR/MRP) protein 1
MTASIDGLNISTIGLLDLRGRLAIIPQDPALFEGTVRDNLDPRNVHDDTELWSVLGKLIWFLISCFLHADCV